jgi:predicted transcriptional regulator
LNPDAHFEVGKKEFLKPDGHFEVGKTGNSIAYQEKQTPTAAHFGVLANSLRKGAMKNTIKPGRIRAAKLLLHFYEHKPGDYPTLVKLTGLSYYGLGKMIASMKKRGWLVKDGWQQFKLTPAGRKIVEDGVWGNNPQTS